MRAWLLAALTAISVFVSAGQASAETAQVPPTARIVEALQNITVLERSGRVGHATFWDANKWVQCRLAKGREMHCEAAGSLMQPTLGRVLTPDRVQRIGALGWRLDPAFGNHFRDFAADAGFEQIAAAIVTVLREGYDADTDDLAIQTNWVADVPCPPRSGPTQNLAGSVTDAPAMRAVVITSCSYVAKPTELPAVASPKELIERYGVRVAAEIQRLRINASDRVFAIFDPGLGYIQCRPNREKRVLLCEAQSIDTYAPLAAVLTPERAARLKAAGYQEPGRGPNHWKYYSFDTHGDRAIAEEILTLLHEAYGYTGRSALKITAH